MPSTAQENLTDYANARLPLRTAWMESRHPEMPIFSCLTKIKGNVTSRSAARPRFHCLEWYLRRIIHRCL
ncbi:unnamed protein product [Cylicocyclus nassatus]|uniref:Uncharacterized protein n=1 Tax=Cylicocyclus nassatus TaxID=53992 RepID=A0AA36HIF9_CYLNA|nr:unnamed protein product [Cylicocyclus nassatus]